MIVLDATVLIAHLAADRHAPAAAEILDTEDELCLHPLTLAECVVGPMRTGQEIAFRSALDRIGIETWQPDAQHPYRLARLRHEAGLKLPDCCVLGLAESRRALLATFDKTLARVARERGVEVLDAGQPS